SSARRLAPRARNMFARLRHAISSTTQLIAVRITSGTRKPSSELGLGVIENRAVGPTTYLYETSPCGAFASMRGAREASSAAAFDGGTPAASRPNRINDLDV